MSNGLDQYALRNIFDGQADVYDRGQWAYRGTLRRIQDGRWVVVAPNKVLAPTIFDTRAQAAQYALTHC